MCELYSAEFFFLYVQALWRGYCIRKQALIPKRNTSFDAKLVVPQSTLGERYRKAINQIKTSDIYAVIFNGLWNLGEFCRSVRLFCVLIDQNVCVRVSLIAERVTTFSDKLCEGVTLEGIVPIIFNLMSRGNRSEPSLELYRSGISILINLALYQPTKIEMWDNVSFVLDLVHFTDRSIG